MSLSMYEITVPVLLRALGNLRGILDKGAAHAEAHKLDPLSLTGFRLYPDMFPMSRQVQIATDMAKGCVARLVGQEPPPYEDTEKTFEELQARVDKTLDYIRSIPAEQFDGAEDREVTLALRTGPVQFKGRDYLLFFALPNVYFHATTTYDILRHNGVELGKRDFLGG